MTNASYVVLFDLLGLNHSMRNVPVLFKWLNWQRKKEIAWRFVCVSVLVCYLRSHSDILLMYFYIIGCEERSRGLHAKRVVTLKMARESHKFGLWRYQSENSWATRKRVQIRRKSEEWEVSFGHHKYWAYTIILHSRTVLWRSQHIFLGRRSKIITKHWRNWSLCTTNTWGDKRFAS